MLPDVLRRVSSKQSQTLNPGTVDISMVILEALSSICATWSGERAQAETFATACEQRAYRLAPTSWMRSVASVARAELALRERAWSEADHFAQLVVRQAEVAQHLPMQGIGYQLLSDIYEAHGQFEQALVHRRRRQAIDARRRATGINLAERAAGALFEGFARAHARPHPGLER